MAPLSLGGVLRRKYLIWQLVDCQGGLRGAHPPGSQKIRTGNRLLLVPVEYPSYYCF